MDYPQIPIPADFRLFLDGDYHDRCLICDCHLVDTGRPYLIEKAFRHQEVVCEYALCLGCAHQMHERMSEESRAAIERYLARIPWEDRQRALEDDDDLGNWLGHCLVTGHPRRELDDYQLFALCQGRDLIVYHYPFMLSFQAMDEINELLSPETRELTDRFTRDYLNQTPDLAPLLIV